MVIIRGIDPKTYSGVTSLQRHPLVETPQGPLERMRRKTRLQSDLSEAVVHERWQAPHMMTSGKKSPP
jgi:hypothetical protein